MHKKILIINILVFLCFFTSCSSTNKDQTSINVVPGISNAFENITNYDNIGVITESVVDIFKEPKVQSDRLTQALYNQPVIIVEKNKTWTKVNTIDGTEGWLKSRYLSYDCDSVKKSNSDTRIIVTVKKLKILTQPKAGSFVKEAVMGTEFYPINSSNSWYEIALPDDKTGWISESGTIHLPVNKKITKTTANDFVATAMKFVGTIYISGGTSCRDGIDSAGLAYICSKINGVEIPRSPEQQYKCGNPIDKKSLLPGDLIFFSSSEDLKNISEVGIFVGKGQFIFASKSKGQVNLNDYNENYFQKRLVGIKRIF